MTGQGRVEAIYTATAEGAPTTSRDQVQAVAGRGLEGDRYYDSNAGEHDAADEITLIDVAALQLAARENGIEFAPGEHRRNVEVSGLDLPSLIGTTIRVGDAEVEVLKKNPFCKYLSELTGKPVLSARHKGGVRGRIVTGGTIAAGDAVAEQR